MIRYVADRHPDADEPAIYVEAWRKRREGLPIEPLEALWGAQRGGIAPDEQAYLEALRQI